MTVVTTLNKTILRNIKQIQEKIKLIKEPDADDFMALVETKTELYELIDKIDEVLD
jgi:hypothetical protein